MREVIELYDDTFDDTGGAADIDAARIGRGLARVRYGDAVGVRAGDEDRRGLDGDVNGLADGSRHVGGGEGHGIHAHRRGIRPREGAVAAGGVEGGAGRQVGGRERDGVIADRIGGGDGEGQRVADDNILVADRSEGRRSVADYVDRDGLGGRTVLVGGGEARRVGAVGRGCRPVESAGGSVRLESGVAGQIGSGESDGVVVGGIGSRDGDRERATVDDGNGIDGGKLRRDGAADAAGDDQRVNLRVRREAAGERDRDRVGAGDGWRRNVDALDIVHPVSALDGGGAEVGIGEVGGKRHDVRQEHGAVGGGDAQIEVMNEHRVAVIVIAGRPGRVRPRQRSTDGRRAVPVERVGTVGGGGGDSVFDQFGRAGARFVVADNIGGGLGVHQAPAEFVIGAGCAEVVRRVDEQPFERAGAHELVAEFARV